ncbi:thermonuclease family protein [Haematospirillum sp. 15-248]|uniref:thermonuclease family protein n=1 Tax=Haematospirillum sp. 15-248 TaxID=2723107 RepID=UPI00143C0315|nr:thermonuclease family protein [Haematospirillum sp. 15-248]NKD88157.1 thermonuclease family protein [Haematospirillum sp. 15-248]
MRLYVVFLVSFLLFPFPLSAADIPATLKRVIDGDTAVMQTRDGEKTVRFKGIDTPELKGRCAAEKQAARRAKAATERLLSKGTITLQKPSRDKYGRTAAFVLVDGKPVHVALIRAGHGRAYAGGKRQGWCDGQN